MKKKIYFFIGLLVCYGLLGFSKPKKVKKNFKDYKYEYQINHLYPRDSSFYTISYSQSNHPKISIHVVDAVTKEDLIGVNFVYYKDLNTKSKGDVTDIDGKIALSANTKINKLIFTYIGFTDLIIDPAIIDSSQNNYLLVSLGSSDGCDESYSLLCKNKHTDNELEKIIKELTVHPIFSGNDLESKKQAYQKKIDSCDCKLFIAI